MYACLGEAIMLINFIIILYGDSHINLTCYTHRFYLLFS